MFKPSLYLVGHQGREAFFLHNLLKDKTAMEKLRLVLRCVPLFSLNTFFRVGSAVPKVDKVFTLKCPFLHLGHGAFLELNHPHLVRPFLLHSLSLVNFFLSAPKMLLKYLWPMITIPSNPSNHKASLKTTMI